MGDTDAVHTSAITWPLLEELPVVHDVYLLSLRVQCNYNHYGYSMLGLYT